jgi:hypothetical protein
MLVRGEAFVSNGQSSGKTVALRIWLSLGAASAICATNDRHAATPNLILPSWHPITTPGDEAWSRATPFNRRLIPRFSGPLHQHLHAPQYSLALLLPRGRDRGNIASSASDVLVQADGVPRGVWRLPLRVRGKYMRNRRITWGRKKEPWNCNNYHMLERTPAARTTARIAESFGGSSDFGTQGLLQVSLYGCLLLCRGH